MAMSKLPKLGVRMAVCSGREGLEHHYFEVEA